MNSGQVPCNAITVRPLDTRPSPIRRLRSVANAPRKVIITGTVSRKCLSVFRAADRTSRSAGIIGPSTPRAL